MTSTSGPPRWGMLLAVLPALSVHADPDLWWHLLTGERILQTGQLPRVDPWSYTALGSPWVDHEWLPQIITTWSWHTLGPAGLLLVHGLQLLVLLATWLAVIQRRLPQRALSWLLVGLPLPLLTILCNLRPQTYTWMMVPVVMWLIDRVTSGGRGAPWLLVATIWMWCNTHGGFLFGWGLAGLGLLLSAAGLEGITVTPAQRRQRLAACGALLVVPVFTPYGLDLPRYIARELSAGHADLAEWNPPTAIMWGVLALSVLPPLLGWMWSPRRVRPTAWVGLLVAALAASQAAKFVVLAMMMGAICMAELLAPTLQRLRARDGDGELVKLLDSWPFHLGSLALLLLLQLTLRSGAPGTIPVDPATYPVQAVAWLKAIDGHGKLVIPLGWGGLALYHLSPSWRVSMDGRNTSVYPVALVDAQHQAFVDADVDALLQDEPDAFLVGTGSPMDQALRTSAGWSRRFEGPTGSVYLRSDLGWPDPPAPPRPPGVFP